MSVTFHNWIVRLACGLKAKKFGSRYSPRNTLEMVKMLAANSPTWTQVEISSMSP